jgi:hypothetical protein
VQHSPSQWDAPSQAKDTGVVSDSDAAGGDRDTQQAHLSHIRRHEAPGAEAAAGDGDAQPYLSSSEQHRSSLDAGGSGYVHSNGDGDDDGDEDLDPGQPLFARSMKQGGRSSSSQSSRDRDSQ